LKVTTDDDATEVDLAADARMRPTETGPLGPMLSLEELAADKFLALFDRAQARDFIDVAALAERFGFDRLCQLAKEKDTGFSPQVLRDMLGGFDRFDSTDFGLDETGPRTTGATRHPLERGLGSTPVTDHRTTRPRPLARPLTPRTSSAGWHSSAHRCPAASSSALQ
jgi:hypothetical protein